MINNLTQKKANKIAICIVAHNAHGAISGESGHVGGVERQTSIIAPWLAKNGYNVSVITWDEGQNEDIFINGIREIKICKQNSGLPILRFFYPRWYSLLQAMKKANADIYYQNCAEYVTGQIAIWCKYNNKKFIFSSASDKDCMKGKMSNRKWHENLFYNIGIKLANTVISQTIKQQSLLMRNFSKNSVVLPMPCPGPSDIEYADLKLCQQNRNRILWIGRPTPVKRIDRFLDIVENCPDINFDLVCPEDNDIYSQTNLTRAKGLKNLIFHGEVSRENIQYYYLNALCLLCTSDIEGFPNTFIEAWSYGVPIVTTFDPDNVIANRALGVTAVNNAEIISALKLLISNKQLTQIYSHNCREYFKYTFTTEKAMAGLSMVFKKCKGS